MLVIERNFCHFKFRNIFFYDLPFYEEDCDFINFFCCRKRTELNGFSCCEYRTCTIDLTKDLDELWSKMSRSACKRHIKRAERMGIEIESGNKYEEFYDMYEDFIYKKGYGRPLHKLDFPTLDVMEKYGKLFIAKYDKEIIAGQLYLEDSPNVMYCWISASKRLEVDKKRANLIGCANRLIHWEAIKYAKEKGIKEFDLGGLWSEKDADDPIKAGMNLFKLSFGGEVVVRYNYEKANSKRAKLAQVLWQAFRSGLTFVSGGLKQY